MKDSLRDYLETGKCDTETAVAQDAEIVIAAKSTPMEDLLKNVAATAMVAKDLHYKAKGKPFLANHELADMIAEIEKHKDTINEVYYMGEMQANPPLSTVICGGAVEIVKGLYGDILTPNENDLIGVLHTLCMQDISIVESCKNELGIKSGTQAVLDEISKDSLQYAGFLKNVLSGMGTQTDADAVVEPSPEVAECETEIAVVPEVEKVPESAEEEKTEAQKYMSLVNGDASGEEE